MEGHIYKSFIYKGKGWFWTSAMLFPEAAFFFVRVWDHASDLTFQRMTKGSHGDEAGTSVELLTCVHAEAHGVLCLQQWRCFPLTSFRQRNSHSKMFKDIYMVFLMSKHQRTPTWQGILILFFKKEKRRGELFASMQTSMIKWNSRRNRSYRFISLTWARKSEVTERESSTKWANCRGFPRQKKPALPVETVGTIIARYNQSQY